MEWVYDNRLKKKDIPELLGIGLICKAYRYLMQFNY